MIDFGDVTKGVEYDLMCPNNRVGTVDLFMVSHHGNDASNSPQLVHALHPRVAIMNNSAKKFGRPGSFQAIRSSPGLEDLWQLHYAMEAGDGNNTPENLIANPQKEPDPNCYGAVLGDQGKWIKVSAQRDGTFTVVNSRNNFGKTYRVRRWLVSIGRGGAIGTPDSPLRVAPPGERVWTPEMRRTPCPGPRCAG